MTMPQRKKKPSNGQLPLTFKERNRENTSRDNSSKEIMKIEKKSRIAYPILEKCRKNPVHELGNNELAEKQNSV